MAQHLCAFASWREIFRLLTQRRKELIDAFLSFRIPQFYLTSSGKTFPAS
jgi:hypothetical protein